MKLVILITACVTATSANRAQRKRAEAARIVQEHADKLTFHGYDGGSNLGVKLGRCKGDCDKDSDCQEGLKCYTGERTTGGFVTGCDGEIGRDLIKHKVRHGGLGNYRHGKNDFCYMPNRSDPNNCKSWDCAEWCKYYDDALDATYAKKGCVDDGDSCEC